MAEMPPTAINYCFFRRTVLAVMRERDGSGGREIDSKVHVKINSILLYLKKTKRKSCGKHFN